MLPTKGYFQDIECPYFDNSCGRPYCHFRHRKKQNEPVETTSPSKSVVIEPKEVPTYKPTPKSELASKSHIPISYVPDIVYPRGTDRKIQPRTLPKLTYKPTPISILKNNETSSNEYVPKSENSENVTYNPTSKTDTSCENSESSQSYKPTGHTNNFTYKPTALEICQETSNEGTYKPSNMNENPPIDFSNLDNEFNMIDDIINNVNMSPENKETKKEKTKKSSSSSSKSKHHKKEQEKRESKHKSSHKSHKDDKEKHSRKDKEKSTHRSKEKEREYHRKSKKHDRDDDHKKDKEKTKRKSPEKEDTEVSNSDFYSLDFEDDDFGLDDTMSECYRIFNEYKPEETSLNIIEDEEETNGTSTQPVDDIIVSSKKRIAHSNAPCSSSKQTNNVKKPSILTPGQMLNNRYKIIRETQAKDEGKMILNEVKRINIAKRPANNLLLLEAAKKRKMASAPSSNTPSPSSNTPSPSSLIDDIINGNKKKKITPVSNVLNIQRAKAQLDELNKKKAAEQLAKTTAKTNKIGKRQEHIPEYSLNDIPDVLDADKSKLPVNVRTRFLTMIADECSKLYLAQSDAYKRALNEEYSCYQKCKVLVTYRNSAMLAVNRLRKEIQERNLKNLGPIGSGENVSNESSDNERSLFYKRLEQYVLTDEDLDIHGYPRECKSTPGKSIIVNKRAGGSGTETQLPKNQRKCARCSKIYLVDHKGKVVYKEECIYHPLRKRTIRGQQVYLCCKSNDDLGCATSHTHVCETLLDNSELEGFQTTISPTSENDRRNTTVYALDCEMCYTTKGLELTRVTIVDMNCKTVYESLVKPLNEIIDYNTRFSGITKQQMERTSTGILQVQANILHLCNSNTILIGHSLESDMKALKIVHGKIVDTAVMFPHKMGLPHKRALKALASDYLKKIIQNDVSGHDSAEDAITCMELVKWKIKEDAKLKVK